VYTTSLIGCELVLCL